MPKDLSDVEPNEDDLSPEQERLIVWRDYFELLQTGLMLKDEKGSSQNPWSEEDVELSTWIDVIITEIESDLMHLECGQEEYCRWGDAKDLTELDGNIDVREE
jgi:hypothetical protein